MKILVDDFFQAIRIEFIISNTPGKLNEKYLPFIVQENILSFFFSIYNVNNVVIERALSHYFD